MNVDNKNRQGRHLSMINIQQELELGQWDKPGREGRRARRRIKRAIDKAAKKFRQGEIPVEFDNGTCTGHGLFAKIEQFKRLVGIGKLMERVGSLEKRRNSKWSAQTMLECMLDALLVGRSRFEHMGDLRYEPGFMKVKEVDSMPGEKCYRDLMGKASDETLFELIDVCESLLKAQSAWEGGTREVWLDYDDSVLVLHGEQEGGEKGYNPARKGRPSLKLRVAQISEWRTVLWTELEGGATSLNGNFLSTHEICKTGLTNLGLVLKGVRGDRGVYDEKNCKAFEKENTLYVIKAKMTEHLRQYIFKAVSSKQWFEASSYFDVADITYKPVTWAEPRRFVVVRERIEKESGQECLPLEECYRYQAIVTDDQDSDAQDVWHNYNQRCTVENQIEELKNGFACDQNSQHEFIRNKAFMLMKIISYNLFNWFRRAVLPDEMAGAKAITIRRDVINVPANVTGEGRKRRIHLAVNPRLEKIASIMQEKLWAMLEGFQHDQYKQFVFCRV